MEEGRHEVPGRDQGCGDEGMKDKTGNTKTKNINERNMPIGFKISDLILRLYKHDKDKIPYPVLCFMINNLGGWAGVGIYSATRHYKYVLKKKKLINFVFNYIMPFALIGLIIYGATRNTTNFLFGFTQELLAQIFFIVLALYLVPKLLNKPIVFDISLDVKSTYDSGIFEDKQELKLSYRNTGKQVFRKDEIFWEICIFFESLAEKDILELNGQYEQKEVGFYPMWRFFGTNQTPLFLEHSIDIGKIIVQKDFYSEAKDKSILVLYQFKTIYGNIPSIDKLTPVFWGSGITIDDYPKLGEIKIPIE